MAFLRLSCVALLLVGCDQPKGVVINVSGAGDASNLWLTVGTERSSATDLPRFRQEDESGLMKIGKAVPDGFEIYLDRPELMGESRVALVLDSVVNATPLVFKRDSYVVEPDADALTEVKLAPKELGAGQWICAGRLASGADPGFVVALDDNDVDCDHDGWNYPSDLDDRDPLVSGKPMWVLDAGRARCVVKLGARVLGEASTMCPLDCKDPDDGLFELCLQQISMMRCEISEGKGAITVKGLVGESGNPTWELVRLGSSRMNGYFLPSIQAPSEWSVEFTAMDDDKVGWFLLNDRETGNSKLIRVESKDGGGGIPPGTARCMPRT
jgi:hypothetical protein